MRTKKTVFCCSGIGTVTVALEPFLPNALPLRNSVAVAKQAAGVAQEALSSVVSLVKTSLHEKANSRVSTSSTSSSSSYGMPIAPQSTFHIWHSGQDRSWQLDVVSIDDLDFSDTS
jgi:hypothetical protein